LNFKNSNDYLQSGADILEPGIIAFVAVVAACLYDHRGSTLIIGNFIELFLS